MLSVSTFFNSAQVHLRLARKLIALAVAVGSLTVPMVLHGQVGPKPTPDVTPSVFDIYGGYAYFRPFSDLSKIGGHEYKTVDNINVTLGLDYYFSRHFGVELEGGYLSAGGPRGTLGQCAPACSTGDPTYYTVEAGPIFRYPIGRFIPFAHVLIGGARFSGPVLQPLRWGQGATAGGGADYVLPFLDNHLAIRGQADFEGMHATFGPQDPLRISGGVGDILAFKVSGGLVLRLGSEAPPVPVALACTVQPPTIYPGDPITITGEASNLNPKKTPAYTYTSSGGQITATGASATIASAGLAPGSYTVAGHVQEGAKPYQQANCTAAFSVKAIEPPTLSCSANPSTLMAGDTAMITASGVSPQNRPLTYSYTASAGQISGTGPNATLGTAGLSPSTIDITCNVVDDLGMKATANASVTIQAAAAPPAKAEAQKLCSVAFTRDTKRPMRVDNEAKACLDDIALAMQRSSDARLVIVGDHSADEPADRAAVRTLNVRSYLTKERGIDPSRIELRTDGETGRSVDDFLLVPGAEMTNTSTTVVDPTSITPQGQAYGVPGAHHGKKHKHHHTKK